MDERTTDPSAQHSAATTNVMQAVQAELTAFGEQVAGEFGRLAEALANERDARQQVDAQVRALAEAVEAVVTGGVGSGGHGDGIDPSLSRRVEELSTRLDRIATDVNSGISDVVDAAAASATHDLAHRQETLAADVAQLDQNLRQFDEQAAKLVTYVNKVASDVDAQLADLRSGSARDVERRVGEVVARLDELSTSVVRQQGELAQLVTQRVNQAEDRVNDRMLASEERTSEKFGSQIADVEAHVGRIGAGLDDSVAMLAERLAAVDTRFASTDQRFEELAEIVRNADVEAIDELKEQVASAAGEAMLVRIELERFQKRVEENRDRTDVRLTEVETAIQDQSMDVETAIQLERLEELERAMIELDPAQFVRRADVGSRDVSPTAPPPNPTRPLAAPVAGAPSSSMPAPPRPASPQTTMSPKPASPQTTAPPLPDPPA